MYNNSGKDSDSDGMDRKKNKKQVEGPVAARWLDALIRKQKNGVT
jgi:hypothetical protein